MELTNPTHFFCRQAGAANWDQSPSWRAEASFSPDVVSRLLYPLHRPARSHPGFIEQLLCDSADLSKGNEALARVPGFTELTNSWGNKTVNQRVILVKWLHNVIQSWEPREAILRKISWKVASIYLSPAFSEGFAGGSDSKETVYYAGDLGSIPGLGRFPGGGHGYPLQYSCLENPLDRGAWWATVHGVTRVRFDLVTKPPMLGQQTPAKSQCHNPVKVCFLFIKVHSMSGHLFSAAVLPAHSSAV